MGTTILLENGVSLKLPKRVKFSKQIGDVIVVLTDPEVNNEINNENVYCYNFDGNELWQIEDLNLFHTDHYYTSIYFQDFELCLYNLCGVEVKIIPETGKVLSIELIK